MEAVIPKLLQALSAYGPGFIVAALFFILYLLERRQSSALAEKLQELAVASIKADMEHTKSYASLERVFNSAIQALSGRR